MNRAKESENGKVINKSWAKQRGVGLDLFYKPFPIGLIVLDTGYSAPVGRLIMARQKSSLG